MNLRNMNFKLKILTFFLIAGNFSSDEFEVDPFKKPSNPITTSEFENQGNEQKEEDSVFQATDNWADFTKERSEDSEN